MSIVPLSAFKDNYIWALTHGDQCVVVDPGDPAPVEVFLAERGLQLAAILITHRHNDHVGGVATLRESWRVPVFGPPSIPVVTHAVADRDRVMLPGVGGTATVMAVPGHTEEHVAFHYGRHLFCGDTLFAGGCGRILGTSTATEFHDSLQRIAALPDDTLICCAHEYTLSNLRFAEAVDADNAFLIARVASCHALREEGHPTLPSRLDEERQTNPFLRTSEPHIWEAAERHIGRSLTSDSEVFAALRTWKNVFPA